MTRPALLLLGLVVAAVPLLAAQEPTPRFEVASVKRPLAITGPMDIRVFPNRFVAMRLTLGQLIEQAYNVQGHELIGGTEWVRVERFDVTASPGTEVQPNQMKLMLQALLADRFQLRLSRETRIGTIYRLIPRNIRNLNPPTRPEDLPIVRVRQAGRDGFLAYEYFAHNGTMRELALALGSQLRAPVIDDTKLKGNYDFRLRYALDEPFFGAPPDPNTPTIFTALERELGLKLEASRGPIPVLVIDSVERPTPD